MPFSPVAGWEAMSSSNTSGLGGVNVAVMSAGESARKSRMLSSHNVPGPVNWITGQECAAAFVGRDGATKLKPANCHSLVVAKFCPMLE